MDPLKTEWDRSYSHCKTHEKQNFDEISHRGVVWSFQTKYIHLTGHQPVNFDDLKITHVHAPFVAGADYYPFGLTMGDREITTEPYRYGYQGEYAEKDEETGWNHFELREYDPVIGRTITTDPAGQFWSSYMWVGNNPISGIDPTGGVSPIYDLDGNLLGTDNQGLQGDAIFMHESHFVQGMDHESALEAGFTSGNYFQLSANVDSWIKGMDHFATLRTRPDYDGIVTLDEALAWRKGNSGETLFIDISKLDLTPLTTKSFDGDKMLKHNFFFDATSDDRTGRVHGTLSMRLKNAATGEVGFFRDENGFFDTYDFNPDGRFWRDKATWVTRKLFAGDGKDYGFKPYGANPKVPVK